MWVMYVTYMSCVYAYMATLYVSLCVSSSESELVTASVHAYTLGQLYLSG